MADNLSLRGEVNIATGPAKAAMAALAQATKDYAAATFSTARAANAQGASLNQLAKVAAATSKTQVAAAVAAGKARETADLSAARVSKLTMDAESNRLIAMGKKRLLNAQATSIASARRINEARAIQQAEDRAEGLQQKNLANTRYALYDVARVYGVLGAAVEGAGVAAVATAIKFESAFSGVQRTNIDASTESLNNLQQQLLDLSETIPVGFTDLAGISTLGSQLGIATEDLGSFTETVSKFSATTNVSTDEAAQDFGRLSNLLKVPAAQFEQLGSSVAFVGVKSVATETEILNLATSIGASTTQAGFLADQTIGLAGALASLRIQPEQARGVILRLFNTIDKTVSQGGAKLSAYAKIMGVTSEQAADLWKDPNGGAEKFFDTLLKGLSHANNLNDSLTSLGVTETRETNVLQRLAGNYDVYADSIANASSSYAEGTFLTDAYGKVSEDVASKIATLVNTIQEFAAKAGSALLPIIGPAIEVLKGLLDVMLTIPAPVLGIVAAITIAVGGFLLYKAAMAAAIAGTLAFKGAISGLAKSNISTGISVATLRTELQGLKGDLIGTGLANKILTTSIGSITPASRAAAAAQAQQAAASVASSRAAVGLGESLSLAAVGEGAAATGARGFTAALLGVPIVNIIAGLALAIPLITAFADGITQSSQRTDELGGKLLDAGGGMDAFRKATALDAAAAASGKEVYRTLSVSLDSSAKAQIDAADAASKNREEIVKLTGDGTNLAKAVDTTTGALKSQTAVLGDNAKAFIANALATQGNTDKDSAIAKIATDSRQVEHFKNIGASLSQAIVAGLKEDGGAEKYLVALELKAEGAAVALGGDRGKAAIGSNAEAQNLKDLGDAIDGLINKTKTANTINALLGASLTGVGTDAAVASAETEGLTNQLTGLFAGLNLQSKYMGDLQSLSTAILDNGVSFSTATEAGRANLDALQTTLASTVAYANQTGQSTEDAMAQVFASLKDQGVDTTKLLHELANSPIDYTGDIDVSAIAAKLATVGISSDQLVARNASLQSKAAALRSQIASASKSGGGGGGGAAGSSLKTLTEYVNDLGAAMEKVFSKRYGLSNALDDTATQFNSMRKKIDDAKQSVLDLSAALEQLKADRGVLDVQGDVAAAYGDTTRLAEINAAKSKNGADQQSTSTDLNAAQGAATFNLKGNTQAAIDNRAAVQSLLSAYEKQIQAYAAAGHSTAQVTAYTKKLRAEFKGQLADLGVSSGAVTSYGKTFDLLAKAINGVPKHKTVTVSANTSGASNNIAKLKLQLADLDKKIAKNARGIKLLKQIESYRTKKTSSPSQADYYAAQAAALQKKYDSGNYAFGGRVNGPRPTNKRVDNLTANVQAGEWMIQKQAADYYGDDFMNAINQRQFDPSGGGQPVYVQGGGGNDGPIELGPRTLRFLSQSSTPIYLDGKLITTSVNNQNAVRGRRGK